MAGVARLELATFGFGDQRSTDWNYTPINKFVFVYHSKYNI